jgi:hypothetical protein
MIRRFLSKIPHRTIVNCDRDPLLTRWYLIRTAPIAVFLHLFHRSDEDRALHDHPWNFITVILWNGYLEHTPAGIKRRWPFTIHYRPATWQHRVELINGRKPLTLFIRFREHRVWGFWEKTGFIAWNKWWQQNCE